MIGSSLLLVLLASPQIVPSKSELVVAHGAVLDGKLDPRALLLGAGGLRATRSRAVSERGRIQTPGGALVRAQAAGVKIDFPGGRELLITPSARIHLRGGEHTLPFLRGLRLVLVDGTVITVQRANSTRQPLASVDVSVGGRDHRIWSVGRQVVDASHPRAFRGGTVVALGDGGAVYAISSAGPVIGLERVLCPQGDRDRVPTRRLVVLGDVLADSLKLLPAHAPRKSVQFPQVAEAARRFADLGALFDHHHWRPPGAVGELWVSLGEEYRIKVHADEAGRVILGLFGATGDQVPGVEWTFGARDELHFVRPTGGTHGGPRYFMRGIDLRTLLHGVVPCTDPIASRAGLVQLLSRLGGRMNQKLKVGVPG
ncbi:MAG: hypothetical protein KDC87_06805, partial [Planctomycetes bacterium]|nr:hypothetical protein [Planctomycetota bacterium]